MHANASACACHAMCCAYACHAMCCACACVCSVCTDHVFMCLCVWLHKHTYVCVCMLVYGCLWLGLFVVAHDHVYRAQSYASVYVKCAKHTISVKGAC